jgi:hypothetical protein
MYPLCFCYFLLNTSQNVQMDRIDDSICISEKNSGLRTIKLAFGIPEPVFSSIFHLAFACSFSIYLLILFKQKL